MFEVRNYFFIRKNRVFNCICIMVKKINIGSSLFFLVIFLSSFVYLLIYLFILLLLSWSVYLPGTDVYLYIYLLIFLSIYNLFIKLFIYFQCHN